MKLTWQIWLIFGLTAIIIYLILTKPKKPDSQAIVNARDSITQLLNANHTHLIQEKTLATQLIQTKVKSRVDSARFMREITVKDQQLAKKRVRIDTLILENPNLASYMQTADSVFAMLHVRIDTLESQKAFQERLYTDLIVIKVKQIENLEQIITQKDLIIESQEKTIKKSRRGNRLLKVGIIALPVGALILGSSL